jgi:NAD(P)-dependent dehydrogenase (short-subunit alcohol dehydrogenase family)
MHAPDEGTPTAAPGSTAPLAATSGSLPAGAPAGALRAADDALEPRYDRRRAPRGRLAGKIALVTGAGGNIGEVICRRYLQEGATVVMVGRDAAKLDRARERLRRDTRAAPARITTLPLDAAEPAQVRHGIDQVIARHGRIDVVVNNAGSAGPKRRIGELPFTREELVAADGTAETETVHDAARNLLGLAWNVVRAAAPHLRPGASVINVSTIFSRTHYFGRAAYVVPKAALNAWSRLLATELGARGVRVNTVFPGPIASERIRTVFAAMDRLRAAPDGTTADEYLGLMTLGRTADPDAAPARTYPTPDDVANTIVFLGLRRERGDQRAQLRSHARDAVRQESRSTWVSRPELRTVDGTGARVLVAAGDQVSDALAIARIQADLGALVLLGLGSEEAVRAAAEVLHDGPRDRRITPVLFDRTRVETMRHALAPLAADGSSLAWCGGAAGARRVALPRRLHRGERRGRRHLPRCGAMRRARGRARADAPVAGRSAARGPPACLFMSNGDDARATASPTCCAPRPRSSSASGATRARPTVAPGSAASPNGAIRSCGGRTRSARRSRSRPGRPRGCSTRGGACGRSISTSPRRSGGHRRAARAVRVDGAPHGAPHRQGRAHHRGLGGNRRAGGAPPRHRRRAGGALRPARERARDDARRHRPRGVGHRLLAGRGAGAHPAGRRRR